MSRSHPKFLSEYLEGELSPLESARIQVHLLRCAFCRASLHRLRQTVEALEALPLEAPPPGFLGRLEARIDGRALPGHRRDASTRAPAPRNGQRVAPAVAARVSRGRTRRRLTLSPAVRIPLYAAAFALLAFAIGSIPWPAAEQSAGEVVAEVAPADAVTQGDVAPEDLSVVGVAADGGVEP